MTEFFDRADGGKSRVMDDVVRSSISATAALGSNVPGPGGVKAIPEFIEPVASGPDINSWTIQLQAVLRMISASKALGLKRQVFFCQLNDFDTHDSQNPREATSMARLAQALCYFDEALGAMGLRNQVTTFTASDFSRSFTCNGTGTDHAWGGHHFIMGGAVKGGDMYGRYPTLGVNTNGFVNPDKAASGNNFVPTTSVDQYGATLGRWLGVSESDLHTVFPNLSAFPTADLKFMSI